MTIQFKVDPDRLTLDDVIAVESGTLKTIEIRNLLARFVLDDAGQYLPEPDALKRIGGLTLGQLKEAMAAFGNSLKQFQDNAVNPPSASASN